MLHTWSGENAVIQNNSNTFLYCFSIHLTIYSGIGHSLPFTRTVSIHRNIHFGNSELVETDYSDLSQWRSAAQAQKATFKVDVFDADAGVHIAAVEFTIPDAEPTQARLISDVTALRRAVAEKTCK